MRNHAQVLLENVRQHTDEETYGHVAQVCGEGKETPDTAAQAACVAAVLTGLPRHCGKQQVAEIVQHCGFSCIADELLAIAKDLYEGSADMANFLQRLNEKHIGGGKLHIEGDCVVGVYETCYCDLPKAGVQLPASYCDCSAGWFRKLFSSVLGRDVAVEKQGTILSGAKECTFLIKAL